mgnify:CR=1 FL=1
MFIYLWPGRNKHKFMLARVSDVGNQAQVHIGFNRRLGDTCILEPPKVGLIEVGDLSSGVGGGWYEIEGAALGIADDQTEVSCAPRHG